MKPTQELIEAIDQDRSRAARRMSPEEELWAGARLFDDVCERMKAGIRMQFPEADERRVTEILRERLRRLREFEERGIYRLVENPEEQS